MRWRRVGGSALILTVVLTSLLAIVGVLFLMASRIDKMATTAVADNRQLGFAVDSVVAQISETLARDVPGAANGPEYYDYPDSSDAWLADLEPNGVKISTDANDYEYSWRQVSDLTGKLGGRARNVHLRVIGERDSVVDINVADPNTNADADGDGVGDALWFTIAGMATNKGDPIYAAVRIVDNGGMLNVNTGCGFNPDVDQPITEVDGHTQLHVDAASMSETPGDMPALLKCRADPGGTIDAALRSKLAAQAADKLTYETQVIWGFGDASATGSYTPFDLSDELELRYRYLLNQQDISTRVEKWGAFESGVLKTPVETGGVDLDTWYLRATGVSPTVNGIVDVNAIPDSRYAYRHIATTYNLDRILTPRPVSQQEIRELNKRLNVNTANDYDLSQAISTALSGVADPEVVQIVANIREYIDEDSEITPIYPTSGTSVTSPYYGFEQPCIYLSELAFRFVPDANSKQVYRSWAIELCKPYPDDRAARAGEYRLNLGTGVKQIVTWSGTNQFHVLLSEDSHAPLQSGSIAFKNSGATVPTQPLDSGGFGTEAGRTIMLERNVGSDTWITVDKVTVSKTFMPSATAENGAVHRFQRDLSEDRCILRLWGLPRAGTPAASLGNADNNFTDPNETRKVQAHPANRPLVNIGELGMIFAKSAYNIDPNKKAASGLLIDMNDPAYQNLFNYLTVMDPVKRNPNGLTDVELRVKGRININTAPPFVLAQLPWMTYRHKTPGDQVSIYRRARQIKAYRDKHGAFTSIGGLLNVPGMRELGSDGINNLYDVTTAGLSQARGPDLTLDNVIDDPEERDLLFTRVSDLVTVRSDVFTAYILVRLGRNGPQKRVVAILDRSLTRSATQGVRVVSIEQVPDPR